MLHVVKGKSRYSQGKIGHKHSQPMTVTNQSSEKKTKEQRTNITVLTMRVIIMFQYELHLVKAILAFQVVGAQLYPLLVNVPITIVYTLVSVNSLIFWSSSPYLDHDKKRFSL